MSNVIFVGAGGFAGAILRYIVASFIQSRWVFLGIPIGTLSVNIIGCLLFGLLGAFASKNGLLSNQTRLLLFTGFLGSFTTYSTFGFDSVSLAQEARFNEALLYVVLHLVMGFGAIVLGQHLAQYVDIIGEGFRPS